jgi:mxaA protein
MTTNAGKPRSIASLVTNLLVWVALLCAAGICQAAQLDSGWAEIPEVRRHATAKEDRRLRPGWAALPMQDRRVKAFDLHGPRAYGLLTGDKVRQQILITVERPYQLQRSSLPPSRWVNSWLELQAAKVKEAQQDQVNRYVISIGYQIFSTPRLVTLDTIPGFDLSFFAADDSFAVKVPDWIFSISPLLEPEPLVKNIWEIPVRADVPPPLVSATLPLYGLVLFGGLSAALGAYWLYLYSVWPFGRGGHAPFAQALRALHAIKRRANDEQALRDGFRTVHEAFNQTAGEVVFAEHLERFFEERPSFASRRAAVETFFDNSQWLFFGENNRSQATNLNLSWLESMCRQYRAAERNVS